jgi:hypothetical protein
MDPNANLDEQRVIVARMHARLDGGEVFDNTVAQRLDGERLADLMLALDDWIVGGGFLPASWQQRLLPEQPAQHSAKV